MNVLWWLILGLLLGWLIELVIDYGFWRRRARVAAARLAEQGAALEARSQALDQRGSEVELRDQELTSLQAALAARDAELLTMAKRIDERGEEVTRLEQAMDKRRADLERMALTLNEREKDIAARDAKLKAGEADYAGRHDELVASEADMVRRVAVVSNRESAMQNWEERILTRERELGDKEGELVKEAAAAAQLRADLGAMKSLVGRHYKRPDGADDLQAIEGIGPKVSELLHKAGIRTFERLSETSLGELTRVLEAGGSRFGLADPRSWAEQAACLVSGDYVAFEQMREELVGGIRRDAELLQKSTEAGPSVQKDSALLPGGGMQQRKAAEEAPDEAADEVAGEAADGALPNEESADGALPDEASADGVPADGVPADGASADGASAEGARAGRGSADDGAEDAARGPHSAVAGQSGSAAQPAGSAAEVPSRTGAVEPAAEGRSGPVP